MIKQTRLAGLALLFLFFACAGLNNLVQTPRVDVAGVGLQDLSFESITIDFDILVDNPNAFGVSLNKLDYRFSLENQELFSGSQNQSLIIAAQKQNHVHFPLTLKFKELYSLVQNTKNLDTLNYHFDGQIIPGGLLSSLVLPFSKSGALPNLRLPQISLQSLKVNKLSLSGAELDLILKLKNPNIFGFDIGKFNYAISLKGTPVASGLSENLAAIPAKGSGEIRLPIKLNLLGAASSLTTVLSGGQVDCSISGNTDLRSPFGALNLPFDAKQTIAILK